MSEKRPISRSETVRRRRQEGDRQQPEPRRSRTVARKPKAKSGYRELPPITARGVVNDFAIERRKQAGKRRFNAAISLPLSSSPYIVTASHPNPGWLAVAVILPGAASRNRAVSVLEPPGIPCNDSADHRQPAHSCRRDQQHAGLDRISRLPAPT